ncbi:DUF771 domain-containing protein [Limosilactobacillus reuteri]|uniref:DUF771 domain-containing protein n=1 Tax=Limosilactobacillus reuteri TaxID=1598 RepID=UPI001C0AD1CE|nr:DUF771 domain-containing protein [Limosilactobacillus reuteri]QWS05209.1 DUF771 domain-containing protein [Limosilactobacillus reuteri]
MNHKSGETWKIHEGAQRLNKGDNWMRKAILINPRYLDDLKRIEAEETVWETHGTSPWMFKATTFAQLPEEHLSEFPMNGSK